MINPEYVKILAKAKELDRKATKLFDKKADLVMPIFDALVQRADIAEIEEILPIMECAFYRAELRGYLKMLKEKQSAT